LVGDKIKKREKKEIDDDHYLLVNRYEYSILILI